MSQVQNDEALSAIASAMDETHDGLVAFTNKLRSVEDIPSFWWMDHPVWLSDNPNQDLHPWPLRLHDGGKMTISSPNGRRLYRLEIAAFQDFSASVHDAALTDAEFTLFVDLAAGLSVEDSALKAALAISTRRKQLQNSFRKLRVANQAACISLASRMIERLSATLTEYVGHEDREWSAYLPFLPKGARCGVIEGPDNRAVRYLEIGPATGRPVIILHPMMFPHIDEDDVALFDTLNVRAIWPLRAGCLSLKGSAARDWDTHCRKTVEDIRTVQKMCADVPVPIVALVSSGAYATRFAETYPASIERIDFVSTCFSAGKTKLRDVYFGDFLLRSLKQNGRIASVAIQHLASNALRSDHFEPTLRRVFRGSAPDQAILDQEFSTGIRAARARFMIRHSISSMRFDYLAQLRFCWTSAAKLSVPMCFWHGAHDKVHDLSDLTALSLMVSGQPPNVIEDMGHLTQGAPLRRSLEQIAATYSK